MCSMRSSIHCHARIRIHSHSINRSIICRSIHIPNDGMYNVWYHTPFINENKTYATPNDKGVTVARFPSHLIDEPIFAEDRSHRTQKFNSLSFLLRALPFNPEDMARRSSKNMDKQHVNQPSIDQFVNDSPGLHPCPLILPPLDKLILVSIVTGKRSLVQTAQLVNAVRGNFSVRCARILSEYCLPGHMIWIFPSFPAMIISDADLECELIQALKQCKLLNKKVSDTVIMSIKQTIRHPIDSQQITNLSIHQSAVYPSIVKYKAELDKRIKLETEELSHTQSQSKAKSKKTSQSASFALPVALALRSKYNESKYGTINQRLIKHPIKQSLTEQLLALEAHLRPDRISRAHHRPWSAQQALEGFNSAANQPFNPKLMRSFSKPSWPVQPIDQTIKFLIKCMHDRFKFDSKADSTWVANQVSEMCIWSKMMDVMEADGSLNQPGKKQSNSQSIKHSFDPSDSFAQMILRHKAVRT